jgi:hypothetical protein
LAYLVEALDLLGRAHTLQSQVIEPGDARAVEVRKDQSMTLTSAAKRWLNDLPVKDRGDSMSLMIVSSSIYVFFFVMLMKQQAIHHAYVHLKLE